MTIYKSRLDWVRSISKEELEKRFKDAKTLAETAKKKISFYEEELERRKQEKPPLGVPFIAEKGEDFWYINPGTGVCLTTNNWTDTHQGLERNLNMFRSQDSVHKHAEMLLEWRKALVANAKSEPIDIKVLLPLLPKGWVCMNEGCSWVWCKEKPELINNNWTTSWKWNCLTPFNIKPAKDWKTSLMECGL